MDIFQTPVTRALALNDIYGGLKLDDHTVKCLYIDHFEMPVYSDMPQQAQSEVRDNYKRTIGDTLGYRAFKLAWDLKQVSKH